MCGDSLELLKTFPDCCADMILTDPPYNISKKNKKINRTKINNRKRKNGATKDLNYDFGEWDRFESREAFLEWTEKWVREAFRILKPTGNFISFFDKRLTNHFQDIIDKYGYTRQTLVWHKTNPVPQIFKVGFASSTEFITWATKQKGAKHTFNYYLNHTHNFIETPICMGKERTKHPTQKPLKVICWLIEYLSNEGDLIIDPFLGSGTTAIAAKKLGRRFLGIDINPEYCRLAEERILKCKN